MTTAHDERLARTLQQLYEHRFSPAEAVAMNAVWKVLVEDFFQARLRPDATVVDIGAGSCSFINHVHANRRIALDANPNLAMVAAAGVETHVTHDLELDELRDVPVGHVFMSNFLEHLPSFDLMLSLLARIHEVLEPGGTLLVLQPNFRLNPRRYFDFVDHTLVLTDASLVEALEVAGFSIIEKRLRFLPYTSKSKTPKWPIAVKAYLRIRPAQWVLGKQTFIVAQKPPATA